MIDSQECPFEEINKASTKGTSQDFTLQYSLVGPQTWLWSRDSRLQMEAVSTMVQRRMHFATVLDARVLGYLPSWLYHTSGLRSMHKHPMYVYRQNRAIIV